MKNKMMKVVVKKVNKTQEVVTIPNELKALQSLVGGIIEIVEIGDGVLMVCNEEGKLKNLYPNLIISDGVLMVYNEKGKGKSLYPNLIISDGVLMVCNEEGKLKNLYPNLIISDDVIVGNIFFCANKDCDFCSLNEKQIEVVTKFINDNEITTTCNDCGHYDVLEGYCWKHCFDVHGYNTACDDFEQKTDTMKGEDGYYIHIQEDTTCIN